MSRLRQLLPGALVVLLSISVVAGGISVSYLEGDITLAQIFAASPPTGSENPSPPDLTGPQPPPLATAGTFSATVIITTPGTHCPPPPGWKVIVIQTGDTLSALAGAFGVSLSELREANCIIGNVDRLIPGSNLNVPDPRISASSTPTALGEAEAGCPPPPTGWILYTVEPGDNLFRLSNEDLDLVQEIMAVNCMTSSFLRSGMTLYLPRLPVQAPTGTPSPRPSRTATTTVLPAQTTVTPPTATLTPMPPLPPLSPTVSQTAPPTATHTATASHTPPPTPTPSPSATPLLTPEITVEPPPSPGGPGFPP